jgi:hypothetical protein
MKLAAVGSRVRHAISARFVGRSPGAIYRLTVWVKAGSAKRLLLEARDSVDEKTREINNYGTVAYDLSSNSVVDSKGAVRGAGVELADDDWKRIWLNMRTADGVLYIVLALLEGDNNNVAFRARGQHVTFGGFEIGPPKER